MDALTGGAPDRSVRGGFARAPFRVRVMVALAVTSLIPMLVIFSLLFLDVLGLAAGGTLSLLAVSTGVLMLSGAIVIWDLSREADRTSQQWRALSLTDELTGAYNRRYCMTQLQQEIARAGRYHHSLSVVLIDVDHFKEI
ncbi:MAG TPA: diguanylate cyclase, partial [Candidatus Limnocylindrales bacterium]|nr:diguanylate cyclase [Candidatus Limnocylindrales bacterium]